MVVCLCEEIGEKLMQSASAVVTQNFADELDSLVELREGVEYFGHDVDRLQVAGVMLHSLL